MIRGVIFDMDGVLINSEPFYKEATKEFLEKNNIEFPEEEIEDLVGIDFRGLYDFMYEISKPVFSTKEEMRESLDESFRRHEINVEELVFDDAISLLKDLNSMGYPTALASNAGREYIMEILTQLDIVDLFDIISSAEDFEKGKPDPEIYISTAEKLFLKPENVLIIEDSEVGINAANASGGIVVCRKEEYFNFPQNTEYKFTDLRNIKSFIEEYNKEVRIYPISKESKNHLKALFFIQQILKDSFERIEPDIIILQEDQGEITGVLFIDLKEDEMEVENWFVDSLTEEDLSEFIREIEYLVETRKIENIHFINPELEEKYRSKNEN